MIRRPGNCAPLVTPLTVCTCTTTDRHVHWHASTHETVFFKCSRELVKALPLSFLPHNKLIWRAPTWHCHLSVRHEVILCLLSHYTALSVAITATSKRLWSLQLFESDYRWDFHDLQASWTFSSPTFIRPHSAYLFHCDRHSRWLPAPWKIPKDDFLKDATENKRVEATAKSVQFRCLPYTYHSLVNVLVKRRLFCSWQKFSNCYKWQLRVASALVDIEGSFHL